MVSDRIPAAVEYERRSGDGRAGLPQRAPVRVMDPEWLEFVLPSSGERCFLHCALSIMVRYEYARDTAWYDPRWPWYVDMVSLRTSSPDDALLHVRDAWIDVLLSPDATSYKVLDFDEIVAAQRQGFLSLEEMGDTLVKLQEFLQCLHGYRPWSFPVARLRAWVDGVGHE
jgi:hypothetical protein